MRRILASSAVVVVSVLVAPLSAAAGQSNISVPDAPVTIETIVVRTPNGEGPIATPVGLDRRSIAPMAATRTAAELTTTASTMQPQEGSTVAMMVVGAVAVVAGLVIEGDAGTAIAVGGAVIGLIGLWRYVR
jgi:hypothetical protein